SDDRILKLWDLNQEGKPKRLVGHKNSVWSVAVTSDGKQAVSASSDCTLKLWDLEQGVELKTLKGHRNSVRSVAVTPDSKRTIFASGDCTLKLWDLASGQVIASFGGDRPFYCCAIAPDNVTVVAGDAGGGVHFFKIEG